MEMIVFLSFYISACNTYLPIFHLFYFQEMQSSILYKFSYISWQPTWTSLSAIHHPAVGREMEKVIHLFVSFDLAQFLEYKLTKISSLLITQLK